MPQNAVGTIFNIQRFSIHDGPGARTTVFFKGCNLRCRWCHNPESISFKKQIEFYPAKCIGCGACFAACPEGAHALTPEGAHVIDRAACTGCLRCADTCYAKALGGVGQTVDADYLMKAILTDRPYFEAAGGGVTFSGGECMLQIDFLAEVLRRCREEGIHTAVDTAGNVAWFFFEKILPYTDLFLYDVKAADPERHKACTGADNALLLENLRRLSEAGKRIFVRIPFIPGFNDDQIEGIASLLEPLAVERVEVVPYHKLGLSKYEALGLVNETGDVVTPGDERVEAACAVLRAHGLDARPS